VPKIDVATVCRLAFVTELPKPLLAATAKWMTTRAAAAGAMSEMVPRRNGRNAAAAEAGTGTSSILQ